MNNEMILQSIGYVKKREQDSESVTWLEIKEEFLPGLLRLESFSHLIVIWWISGRDTKEDRTRYQYHPRVKLDDPNIKVETPLCGVFATRSPGRPNPIGLTTVKILKIEGNKIFIDRHDAFNDTPIIVLKPYIPKSDCILNVKLPDFFSGLSEKRLE